MFSTVIAWSGFILSSIFFLLLIADAILNKKANDMQKLIYRAAGKAPPTYLNGRMLLLCVVWIASGIYLWG